MLQPLLNSIFPDLNERLQVFELLDEVEEEEDSNENRTLEEEFFHFSTKYIGIHQEDNIDRLTDALYPIVNWYQNIDQEVNTPPPKFIFSLFNVVFSA